MTKKLFIVLITACVCVLSCENKEKPKEEQPDKQVETKAFDTDLPLMPVALVDGTNVQMKDIKGKSVLVLFQPDCEDCQHEAEAIKKNLSAFESYKLYFISSYPLDIIQKFAVDYKLIGEENVYFGNTTVQYVLNNFGAIHAPSIYVYNENGKLTASFSGQTEIDAIVKAL